MIRPRLRKVVTPEKLVRRITLRKIHDEVDFSEPVGREAG
jgi:hypothetical protein